MQNIKNTAERLLGRSLIKTEGIKPSDLDMAELRLGHPLPKSLTNLYLEFGKNTLLLESFNCFALPSQLQLIDNKIIFLEENQGVCYWGFDVDDENPQVYQSPYENEWYSEKIRLDEFLSMILYYQCAHGYEFGGIADITNEGLEIFIHTEWEDVVHYNGLQIFWKPGCLLWYLLDEDHKIIDHIYFSALTQEVYNSHKEKYNLTEAD